jgi:hypothetical protein
MGTRQGLASLFFGGGIPMVETDGLATTATKLGQSQPKHFNTVESAPTITVK